MAGSALVTHRTSLKDRRKARVRGLYLHPPPVPADPPLMVVPSVLFPPSALPPLQPFPHAVFSDPRQAQDDIASRRSRVPEELET